MLTFTENKVMFEDLWQEWLDTKLYLIANGTSLMESGYDGIFKSLTKEKQMELIKRKADYAKVAGICM